MAVLCRSLPHFVRNVGKSNISIRTLHEASEMVDVNVSPQTGIAVMTLQRHPVNSLNLEFLTAIGTALQALEKDQVKGLILTSASPKVFSAGLDLLEMYKPEKDRVAAFWSTLQSTWLKLYSSSFPTVAAINGTSPAGGCMLALSCEYRIMVKDPSFKIGFNETQFGMIAPRWFEILMRNVIGPRQTEWALTQGYMFSVDEALSKGLIDEVASSKEDALSRAEAFLSHFNKIPSGARKLTKEMIRAEGIKWMEENMIEDLKVFVDYVSQPHVQKGLEIYLKSLQKKQ